jgi:hypothetical protein
MGADRLCGVRRAESGRTGKEVPTPVAGRRSPVGKDSWLGELTSVLRVDVFARGPEESLDQFTTDILGFRAGPRRW